MLKHLLIWIALLSHFELKKHCKSVQNHVKIKELRFDMNEILIRCCYSFNAETCSKLVCSAISLWIEETVQKWKIVQNHGKIKESKSGMNEIMITCCSPFNAETSSNLNCTTISFWIEETLKKWNMFQNWMGNNIYSLFHSYQMASPWFSHDSECFSTFALFLQFKMR